ncbi:hypothetical protein AWI11_01825 [Enterobacter hormaechei subsp. steigerwaltii]|nr:hypothetical protein AWI11_01825 [Enterobacter hormaechei subsp. steigerwaltii]
MVCRVRIKDILRANVAGNTHRFTARTQAVLRRQTKLLLGDREQLITAYARNANINALTLARQVARWRPWVLMLMAGWFEMRLQQTDDKQFIALANDAWRQLQTKG